MARRTLSKNEAKLILDLEWRGQRTVTLRELHAALGGSAGYARYMAHVLARKGWLERLRPGLFQLIPADRGREGVADTNPLAAGAVLVRPYFFSFGTACTYHGLTQQAFADVYVTCRSRRRARMIRGTRYVFTYSGAKRFFGFEEASVLGTTVQMATPERALLDALDRPHYAGGLGEVSGMVAGSLPRLESKRLIEMLERWGESALGQRLGYLAHLNGAELTPSLRRTLERLARLGGNLLLGPRRRWGTLGRLGRPWSIVENVPREVLVERGAARGRRVTFDPGRRRDR